jgi:hypothetical protein
MEPVFINHTSPWKSLFCIYQSVTTTVHVSLPKHLYPNNASVIAALPPRCHLSPGVGLVSVRVCGSSSEDDSCSSPLSSVSESPLTSSELLVSVPELLAPSGSSASSETLLSSDSSSPPSPSCSPGTGATAGSHAHPLLTARQQDVQNESFQWNTLPHSTQRLCEGVDELFSEGVAVGCEATPSASWEEDTRLGLGGVLLVDDAATVATLAGAVVSANMGLVWGCVVAEGIAGHAEVERGAASVELPLRQSWG